MEPKDVGVHTHLANALLTARRMLSFYETNFLPLVNTFREYLIEGITDKDEAAVFHKILESIEKLADIETMELGTAESIRSPARRKAVLATIKAELVKFKELEEYTKILQNKPDHKVLQLYDQTLRLIDEALKTEVREFEAAEAEAATTVR
ncbi:MAG: hypothetical protein ABIH41_01205 [Nanoarchaeota archaeon]